MQGNLLEDLLKGSKFVKHIVLPKGNEKKRDDGNFREFVHFAQRIFLIDNSVSGSASPCQTVNEIRKRVDSRTKTYWSRRNKQPLLWVYLELLLLRWSQDMGTVCAKVDEIVLLAQHPDICDIRDRDEVLVALQYLANVGAILYYPEVDGLKDDVLTSPMWVVKALSAFVTAETPGPNMLQKWTTLKDKGIMSKDLLDYRLNQMRSHASDNQLAASQTSTEISPEVLEENRLVIRLLTLLDIVTPVEGSETGEFYVPSMLRTSIEESVEESSTLWENHEHSSGLPCPLTIVPTELKFVPESLFFRLVTRFLQSCPKRPQLSRHRCIFLAQDDKSTSVEGKQTFE